MSAQKIINYDDLVDKRHIDLRNKGLRDDDINVLALVIEASDVLEVLLLCSNRITLAYGKFVDALARNETILTLNLHHNQIDDEGAKRLAAALELNNTLRNLHLGYNRIGEAGAHGLAKSFAINKSLQDVWMWGNPIGNPGAQKLGDALLSKRCPIKHLHLRNNRIGRHEMNNIKTIHRVIAMEDEMARKDEELAAKDREIASLKAALVSPDNEKTDNGTPAVELPKKRRIVVDNISLSSEETDMHENKRCRVENSPS